MVGQEEQDCFTIGSLETQVTKKTNLLHESESKARNSIWEKDATRSLAYLVMVFLMVPRALRRPSKTDYRDVS